MKAFIGDLSASANQNQFKLQDLLVLPMQRILKYPLLLKQVRNRLKMIAQQ
jgi:RhoGEF domain